MPLTKLHLENFTAFKELDLELSPGINIFIGENGTGKTHLLKVMYAACEITLTENDFLSKLKSVFLPAQKNIARLIKNKSKKNECTIEIVNSVENKEHIFNVSFSVKNIEPSPNFLQLDWKDKKIDCALIPAKEILSNAPGFVSSYEYRDIHFEEIYADIIKKAFRASLKGHPDDFRRKLLNVLKNSLGGIIYNEQEEFYLRTKTDNIEFTLLAEGYRKLGLLYRLIENGTIKPNSVLFWDEPEANLNPKMISKLVKVLLILQKAGTQIFLATHDYVLLRRIEQMKETDSEVVFHSLYHDKEDGEIKCSSTAEFSQINPFAILEAYDEIYDEEIIKSLGSKK
jgi:predicted ATP-dependent endonuclease of OLD family